MKGSVATVASAAIMLLFAVPAQVLAQASATSARDEALKKYKVDPATPLISRVGATPATVLAMFKEAGMSPTAHALTDDERRTVASALEQLTPLHRRVLRERLRSLSFLDGMPNTGLTSTINSGDSYKLFDITFRTGVLHETVSEFLTNKERALFAPADSAMRITIVAGGMPALVYVLLHEATHVVDGAMALVPTPGGAAETPFTQGIWMDRTTVAPAYRNALLERTTFRAGGKPIAVADAESLYVALSRTPFVSVYGSSNWHDDVAELVAWRHMGDVLKQPYRIDVRRSDGSVVAFEPLSWDLVRARFGTLAMFYDASVIPKD